MAGNNVHVIQFRRPVDMFPKAVCVNGKRREHLRYDNNK